MDEFDGPAGTDGSTPPAAPADSAAAAPPAPSPSPAGPGFEDRVWGVVADRIGQVSRATEAAGAVESFWKESAPHVPENLFWHFAEQAAGAYPNDLGKQALFCLEQALGAMARTGSRPRGTAAPAPAPGTPEQPKGSRPSYGNMVEQIRSVQRPRVS